MAASSALSPGGTQAAYCHPPGDEEASGHRLHAVSALPQVISITPEGSCVYVWGRAFFYFLGYFI